MITAKTKPLDVIEEEKSGDSSIEEEPSCVSKKVDVKTLNNKKPSALTVN